MENKTEFKQHTKADLLTICAEFGVEANPTSTKEEILALLALDGIDYSLYKSFLT
jgi:hypothetical protein